MRPSVCWILAGDALHCAARAGKGTLCGRHAVTDAVLGIGTEIDVTPEQLLCPLCLTLLGIARQVDGTRALELCLLAAGAVHSIRYADKAGDIWELETSCFHEPGESRLVLLFETDEGSRVFDLRGGEAIEEHRLCDLCFPAQEGA
jgi:hypothetical protein